MDTVTFIQWNGSAAHGAKLRAKEAAYQRRSSTDPYFMGDGQYLWDWYLPLEKAMMLATKFARRAGLPFREGGCR